MASASGDTTPNSRLDFLEEWKTRGDWETGTTVTEKIYYRKGDDYNGYATTLNGDFQYTVDPETNEFTVLSGTVTSIQVTLYMWTDDSGLGFYTRSFTISGVSLDLSLFDQGLNSNQIAETIFSGNDYITAPYYVPGYAGNDSLIGSDGHDVLDGGAGQDIMTGKKGNDSYRVDSSLDVVVENANEGTDDVEASIDYTLSANVENLKLIGSGNINGTGNALDNTLIGTSGKNILDGKGGADKMFGGLGDDVYYVDNANDVVSEFKNGGNDLVYSSIAYRLYGDLEMLILTGYTDINGTGNGRENSLKGNSGNNRLDGGVANDKVNGGAGGDVLWGGSGADQFIYSDRAHSTISAAGRDSIRDFKRTEGDRINLIQIDANSKIEGNQAFKFIGDDAFHKKAGELRYDIKGGETIVYGDIDGNGTADFSILLNRSIDFLASDFVL